MNYCLICVDTNTNIWCLINNKKYTKIKTLTSTRKRLISQTDYSDYYDETISPYIFKHSKALRLNIQYTEWTIAKSLGIQLEL